MAEGLIQKLESLRTNIKADTKNKKFVRAKVYDRVDSSSVSSPVCFAQGSDLREGYGVVEVPAKISQKDVMDDLKEVQQ